MQTQVIQPDNAAETMLQRLSEGYGYPQGHSSMPEGLGKTCLKLFHAIIGRDQGMLRQILHPDNKRSREAFSKLNPSGQLVLPKTVNGTNQFIADFIDRINSSMKESVGA